MPQMAPLNWTSMLIIFTILFLIMNSMNFFSKNKTPLLSKITKLSISKSWKW
uniref:ATP synthase complex subunit 8 n=1 Tax=Cyclommatus strigiceps vitalisi TaxID=618761 RepID=A0A5H2E196_9SCAR|nr:ATP synthase F0 subunit 8 [Cyclommatus strigiceps vitalisi]ASF90503.1 ATP synthase F0 subunit 8 [Cyclommatus strigiceps vitalisi]